MTKRLLLLAALLLLGCSSSGTCTQQECLRAFECATSCGAPAMNNGCCACPAGTIDIITCPHDGGTDGGP